MKHLLILLGAVGTMQSLLAVNKRSSSLDHCPSIYPGVRFPALHTEASTWDASFIKQFPI